MSQKSKTITDHNEIRKWVEERNGKPAYVKDTGDKKEDIGLLRINFPGGAEDNLEEITWDEFFDKFEKEKLAFLCQDEKADGEMSTFNKLVNR